MSTVEVAVSTDNAVLLLAAAEDLDLGPEVITIQQGKFIVPSEVNKKAFSHEADEKKPAKKAPAKKSQE